MATKDGSNFDDFFLLKDAVCTKEEGKDRFLCSIKGTRIDYGEKIKKTQINNVSEFYAQRIQASLVKGRTEVFIFQPSDDEENYAICKVLPEDDDEGKLIDCKAIPDLDYSDMKMAATHWDEWESPNNLRDALDDWKG